MGGGKWLLLLQLCYANFPPYHPHCPLCSHLGIGERVRVGLIALGAHCDKLKGHAGCHPAQQRWPRGGAGE